MKFTIVDAEAKMLLRHAVELAKGEPEGTAFHAVSRSTQILAGLLGLKSISFDINEFGILSARCEDEAVKMVGHYAVDFPDPDKGESLYPDDKSGSTERDDPKARGW
jgi:hypothetical protein